MSEPILEEIAVALAAQLELITVANGYHQTVVEVVRPTRTGGYAPRDCLLVVIQGDPQEDEAPEGLKAWRQPFHILAFVVPSDSEQAPVDTRINRFRSDIEMCLRMDPTFGGLAQDLRVRAPEGWVAADGSVEGVTVNVDVHYRHLEDNPYMAG